jgi:hypothetical protein
MPAITMREISGIKLKYTYTVTVRKPAVSDPPVLTAARVTTPRFATYAEFEELL